MANTDRTIQAYSTVPAGKPNEGAPAIDDATKAEIQTQAGLTIESERDVKTLTLLASTAGNTFNPLTAKTVIIDMDQNITDLIPSVDGAFDGQLVLFIIKQDSTGGWTLSWKATKFQAGLDIGIPVLQGNADSRDYVICAWNSIDGKFDFVSNVRRYP